MRLFKTTPSLFKTIFVFKNFSGFTSIVNFVFGWKLFKASNKTSCWDLFHQQIIYRMEGSLVFLLYYFTLWYVSHRTTHCTAIYLQKLGLNWIIQCCQFAQQLLEYYVWASCRSASETFHYRFYEQCNQLSLLTECLWIMNQHHT